MLQDLYSGDFRQAKVRLPLTLEPADYLSVKVIFTVVNYVFT